MLSSPCHSDSRHARFGRGSVLLLASLILGALTAGCSGDSTGTSGTPVSVAVLPPVDTLTRIGDTLVLRATVGGQPVGPREAVSWSSLNDAVARVDSLGAVRAVAPGTAPIVAAVGQRSDTAIIVVAVTTPPPTGLALLTQPGGAVSGIAFTQQPVVEVRNGQGQPVAQAGVVVTASKATGAGSLGGTLTATTNAQGRASFATLAIVGTGLHTLDFAAGGLTKATSQGFVVSAPAGFTVNAGADQTIVGGGAAVMNATVTGATPVNMFWTMISGPGKVSLASEQFNSTFDDLTLTDWIGGHQTTIRTTNAPFPDEVGIQGDMGNWYTTDAPPTTDRPRTGAHSWKAYTPYSSNHSAKLLKWNLDDTQAYFSAWVYWPSSEVVSGNGSGGFIDYLNLMQWKERSSPWNPTWVIAVTGLSAGVDQFAIHDWYNNQPIVHTGVQVPKDQWFNLTAYLKEGFGTSGEVTVWLNHALLYHQSGINTLGAATNTTAHLMWGIGNYSNALVDQGEQSIYFDDVTVTPAADVTKTTATFAAPGTYVLRFTAYDGATTKSDDVTITVQ
jgi:Bacterial Ig-like domain (group 2)/Polysaccharide lyase